MLITDLGPFASYTTVASFTVTGLELNYTNGCHFCYSISLATNFQEDQSIPVHFQYFQHFQE